MLHQLLMIISWLSLSIVFAENENCGNNILFWQKRYLLVNGTSFLTNIDRMGVNLEGCVAFCREGNNTEFIYHDEKVGSCMCLNIHIRHFPISYNSVQATLQKVQIYTASGPGTEKRSK